MSESLARDIRPGSIFVVGGRLMGMCRDCEKVVRMDKPIFGSMHVCLTDAERAVKHSDQFGGGYR